MSAILAGLISGGTGTAATGAAATGAATGLTAGATAAGTGAAGALAGGELAAAGAAASELAAAQAAGASFLAPTAGTSVGLGAFGPLGAAPAAGGITAGQVAAGAATAASLGGGDPAGIAPNDPGLQIAPNTPNAFNQGRPPESGVPSGAFSGVEAAKEAFGPEAEALARSAEGAGLLKGTLNNVKDVFTFARKEPAGFVGVITNNFGLGEAGGAILKGTPFDIDGVEGLTKKQFENAQQVVGGLGSLRGGGFESERLDQGPQASTSERRSFEQVQSAPIAAAGDDFFVPGGGGEEGVNALNRGRAPESGTPQASTRQISSLQAPAGAPFRDDRDFLTGLALDQGGFLGFGQSPGDPFARRELFQRFGSDALPFDRLEGGFNRFGTGRREGGANIRTQAARRKFGIPGDEPSGTNFLSRFALEALRSHPLGRLLPRRPLATFPKIDSEFLRSPEGLAFLRNSSPQEKLAAFATDTQSFQDLLDLPDADFQNIVGGSGLQNIGGSLFNVQQPDIFQGGGVERRGGIGGTNQRLIATGRGDSGIERGREVLVSDPDQIAELVNSDQFAILNKTIDPNKRIPLFNIHTGQTEDIPQKVIATFTAEETATYFGDPGVLVEGTDPKQDGKRVALPRAEAVRRVKDGTFRPDAPSGGITNIFNAGDLSDTAAEARRASDRGTIGFLEASSNILTSINSEEFGGRATGRTGAVAAALGGFGALLDDFGLTDGAAQKMVDFVLGKEGIDREAFEQFRKNLDLLAVKGIPVITGEGGKRITDQEQKIAKNFIGIIKGSSDPARVRAAILGLASQKLIDNTIRRILNGQQSLFPVTDDALAKETHAKLMDKYSLTQSQADDITLRLIRVEDMLTGIDLGAGLPLQALDERVFRGFEAVFLEAKAE